MDLTALYTDTLRALVAPRRAVPVAVVVAAMLWAQSRVAATDTAVPYAEMVPAVAMAAAFVLTGPFAWRALFPDEVVVRFAPLRLLAYAFLSAAPTVLGWAVGDALGIGSTYLTYRFHLPVTATLFAAGGWGLARDIDSEQGVARARSRADRLAKEAEHARLLAMRSHLDPHFLFNTLNALAEWTRQDPITAEKGLLRLSALLREVLGGLKDLSWPVARELALARDLLELHRLRDPTWFTLDWDVPDGLAAEVPPLLLLPLVENAVKHGPAKGHRGVVALSARIVGGRLRIVLRNPGPYTGRRDGGEGIGLIEKRLELAYDGAASLAVSADGDGTRAELDAPVRPVEAA